MDNISRHAWETLVALSRAEAAMVKPTRTCYAVRLKSGAYAAPNLHWSTETDHAQTFVTMAGALGYALDTLGLELDDFSVEVL
jgi:hypothetical protein